MPRFPLSKGATQLFRVIKKRYPHLTDKEAEEVGNIVLDLVSSRIGSGGKRSIF